MSIIFEDRGCLYIISRIVITLLLIISLDFNKSNANLLNGWTHEKWVDEKAEIQLRYKFLLKWKFDRKEQIITFRTEVNAKVWFSFGFTELSGKYDILIGWINQNGTLLIKDSNLNSSSKLEIDEIQDWTLLWADTNQTHLIFEFNRKFNTCDTNDIMINEISPNIITYSYGNHSISNFEFFRNLDFSQLNKINLISPVYQQNNQQEHNFFLSNGTLTNQQDQNLCKIFKVEKPTYLTKIEPIVNDELHHIVVYLCDKRKHRELEDILKYESFNCNKGDALNIRTICNRAYFLVYSVGWDNLMSFEDSAFIFGENYENKYFMLELHYLNSKGINNVPVVAGFKGFLANKPRKHAIAEMVIVTQIPNGVVIPPKQTKYLIAGHCSARCFHSNNLENNIVKIIAVSPHAHSTGRKIKLRHFRNGTELPWIINDENFMYNFQVRSYLLEPVIVMPGDLLTVECTYDTSKRNYTTTMGLDFLNEMCTTPVLYYPATSTGWCTSRLSLKTLNEITGIDTFIGYGTSNNPMVQLNNGTGNQSLDNYLTNKIDWNTSAENLMRFNPQLSECYLTAQYMNTSEERYVSYPELKDVYQQKNYCPLV